MATVKVSSKFKSQAYKAIFSILLFIIVYLLLLALSVGIFVACGYGAAMFVALRPSFITLMLGLGLLGVGFFVFYFMIKFLFAKNKSDYSHLTEINIHDEPELYKMIQELVDEIGTDFPKKIYISPQINASVFYDSSFWSMFFPVKKNLHIGIGLVNSTTVTELKGILAHEFGHFSQKSMKVGSYVYNVNKIIYNLLYENDDYGNAVSYWASKSNYFAILIQIALVFNQMIQHVLQFMYKIVNVNYMALSREMEFHADEIATNTVGSQPMINSMLRMDLANNTFDLVIDYYNSKIEKSITTTNIFPNHLLAMNFIARTNKIAIEDHLPKVDSDFYERFNKSKLVIKNQWESHPVTEERVAAFKKLNISGELDNRPANELFSNPTATQEKMTKKMFDTVVYPETPTAEETGQFIKSFEKDYKEDKYPDLYNGYYDNHKISPIDLESIIQNPDTTATLEELYSNEIVELTYNMNAQNTDSETLRRIANKEFKIKTFDYDGNKYKASQAQSVLDNLNKIVNETKEKLRNNDAEIFRFFYQKAKQKNAETQLVTLYKDFFSISNQLHEKSKYYYEMFEEFAFAYETHKFEEIQSKMSNYYTIEARFKEVYQSVLEDELYKDVISDAERTDALAYINDDPVYFSYQKYDDEAINTKNMMTHLYMAILQKAFLRKNKKILDYQTTLI